jgi:RimJ/RimL family protein N-acetyltransferase
VLQEQPSARQEEKMDTLETERLVIRPFATDDLQDAHQLLDEDIQWAGPSVTVAQREARLRLYIALANWDDTGRIYGLRALVLRGSKRMIGICGFHPDLWSPDWKAVFWPQLFDTYDPLIMGRYASLELGIGYALSCKERGRGYATEAVRAALGHAFGQFKVGRVFATTDRGNRDSVRLMERVGMRTATNPDMDTTWPGVVGVVENPLL